MKNALELPELEVQSFIDQTRVATSKRPNSISRRHYRSRSGSHFSSTARDANVTRSVIREPIARQITERSGPPRHNP